MQEKLCNNEHKAVPAEAAFKEIFTTFYKPLRFYAFTLVKNETIAEEIVQDVFCRLWEKKDTLLEKATQAYLYKAIYNESLNTLKKIKTRTRHHASLPFQEMIHDHNDVKVLEEKTTLALNTLPGQCRTIFQMSRFEKMKYREIAETLNISVKTVEAQMSKALRILRTQLADYLPLLCFCIFSLKK